MESVSSATGKTGGPVFLLLDEVKRRTTLSKSAIYDEVKARRFPAPRLLTGRRVAWLEDEVTAWQRARPAAL